MTDKEPRTEADRLWGELLMDALASDGPISDQDVKNAVKRWRPKIEAAASPPSVDALAEALMHTYGSRFPHGDLSDFRSDARYMLERIARLTESSDR